MRRTILFAAIMTIAVTGAEPRIEMTAVDLFSQRDWNSSRAEVWGLHLGMTRAEAIAAAGQRRLKLLSGELQGRVAPLCTSGSHCAVFTLGNVGTSMTLEFSVADELVEIGIYGTLPTSLPQVRAAAAARQFKGSTFAFFNEPYSEAVRQGLFGPESSSEDDGTRLTYAARGLVILLDEQTGGRLALQGVRLVQPLPH